MFDVPPDLISFLRLDPTASPVLPTIALAAAAIYAAGVVRLLAMGRTWSVGRTILFLTGCLSIFATTATGLETYGTGMFSVFMFQQLTLMMITPVLLVLGAPGTLLLRATPHRYGGQWVLRAAHAGLKSPIARFALHPGFTLPLFLLSYYGLYLGGLADVFLVTPSGHVLAEVLFLASGILFTVPILSPDPLPRRQSYVGRILDVFGEMALHAFFGVIVMMAATPLVSAFSDPPTSWGVDPVADQQVAGALAWSYGEAPNLIIVLILLHLWYRSDTRKARADDVRKDLEGDQDLDAYNAYLTNLARQRDPRARMENDR